MSGHAMVPSTAPASEAHSNVVAVPTTRKVAVTFAIKEGMKKLVACFAPQPLERDDDRRLMFHTWAEVTSDFKDKVVEEALFTLLTANPRNPFRPSVQDIVEMCRKVDGQWRKRIVDRFRGGVDEILPLWCTNSGMVSEALTAHLRTLRDRCGARDHRVSEHRVSNAEYLGIRMAHMIGPAIDEWPADLLAEYGVLTGLDRDRVEEKIALAVREHEALIAQEIQKQEEFIVRQVCKQDGWASLPELERKAQIEKYRAIIEKSWGGIYAAMAREAREESEKRISIKKMTPKNRKGRFGAKGNDESFAATAD